ncbi:MAG: hypothetical protein WBW41_03905 [Verrucomicrobiia bacterium]
MATGCFFSLMNSDSSCAARVVSMPSFRIQSGCLTYILEIHGEQALDNCRKNGKPGNCRLGHVAGRAVCGRYALKNGGRKNMLDFA